MPHTKIADQTEILELSPRVQLGYCDLGPKDGTPIFLFHGNPGSRLQVPAKLSVLKKLGIRLITVDRPGYGYTTAKASRDILDWPPMVEALANHLGLNTFAVTGVSAGAPYALACSYILPNRVTNIGVVSGMIPAHKLGALRRMPIHHSATLLAAKHAPWLMQGPMMMLNLGIALWPNTIFNELKNQAPECDRRILAHPDVHHLMLEDFKEAFRQGSAGVETEMRCLSENWKFSLNFVECPVDIYHGTHDTTVPLDMVKHSAQKFPQKQLHVISGEGHFLFFKYAEQILRDVKIAHQKATSITTG